MVSIFKDATNPKQYDLDRVGWSKVGKKGIKDPHRAHFWYYLNLHVPTWKGKLLLDIGTGTGWLLDQALKTGVSVAVGIDPSRKNVELGRKLYPHINIIETTLENYNTEENFDIVISVFSITHIANLENAFKKIADLLTQNGKFYCIAPDYHYSKKPITAYKTTYEEIDTKSYAVSVKRPHGVIADIVRKVEVYEEEAKVHNLVLTKDVKMTPSEILMDAEPKYRSAKDRVVARLLIFSK